MAESKTIPPPVLQSIDKQASVINEVAKALSLRIAQFQEYLNKLPGRIEAIAYGVNPDGSGAEDKSLALKLSREGREWAISWAVDYLLPDGEMNWAPLTDAPLRIKVAAVKIFPNLLESIQKSQATIVQELSEASAYYDTFAQTLQLPKISSVVNDSVAGEYYKIAAKEFAAKLERNK